MEEAVLYLRRSASTGVLNAAMSALCVVLVLPFVIGHLGLEAYGSWAVLGVFVGIASLLDLGMSKALVFLIPRAERSADAWFSAATCACLAVTATVALVLIVLVCAGVPLFGASVARVPGLAIWLVFAGAVVLLCQVATTLMRAVLEARRKAHWVNAGFATFTIVYYLSAAAAASLRADPRLVIAVSAAVYLLTLGVHLQLMTRSGAVRWQWPDRATLVALSRVSFGTFTVDLPTIAYLPVLLWLFMLSADSGAAYGVFDLATRIATLCGTALASVSVPFYALVAGAREAERPAVRQLLERFQWITLAAAVGAWLAFAVIGERLLQWWMPEASASLVHALRWLLAGSLAFAAFEPVTRLLLGLGQTRLLLYIRIAMLAAAVLCASLLGSQETLARFSIAASAGWLLAAGLLAMAGRPAGGARG